MQPDLIREIAEQIVREQFLLNWKVYALICGLGLVAGAAGYWLAPYLKKRAELYATKADMHEVLKQLEETTKVTEQVRVTVSHADWVTREWRTVRRIKLEELINLSSAVDAPRAPFSSALARFWAALAHSPDG